MNEVVTMQGQELAASLPDGYQQDLSLAVQLTRAEVDQQIATARSFPRRLSLAISNILSLATMDKDTADSCIYALPRGGKSIEGPSIRLAEIIFSQYGNARAAARVVHVDRFEKFVEAEGIFHDLETNAATTMRVRRRLVDKSGKLYNEDMIIMTGNAACAIAKRNAIIAGVPRGVWHKAYEAAEQVLRGDIKTLAFRREAAFKSFAALGVTPEQLFIALDVLGGDDISLDHMVTLTGMRSAIKNGEATAEEMFPKISMAKPGASLSDRLDKVAEKRAPTEHIDPTTGEVTEGNPEAEKAQPKPRGRPPKAAEKAQDAQEAQPATVAAPEAEKAAVEPETQEEEANEGEEDAPFDADQDEAQQEEESEPENPIFAAGREAASNGFMAFKKWKNRLTVPQIDAVNVMLPSLEKMAKDADAGNGG